MLCEAQLNVFATDCQAWCTSQKKMSEGFKNSEPHKMTMKPDGYLIYVYTDLGVTKSTPDSEEEKSGREPGPQID